MSTRRRAVAGALGALAAVIAVIVVVVLTGGAGAGAAPPAAGALRLIPADALIEVHVSTDQSRAATRHALKLLGRLPAVAGVRDTLLRRLAAGHPRFDFDRDVRPWLGRDAALALLQAPGATANSLVVVDVARPARARAFLAQVPSSGTTAYQGVPITTRGASATAFVSHYLVVGPPPGVRAAIDASAGRAPSLAGSATYRRAASGLPGGRFADGYLSAQGVRRLLRPQGGAIGAAGALLDQPGLRGSVLALSAGGTSASLRVRSVLTAGAGRRRPALFAPALAADVPAGTTAYLGTADLGGSLGALLQASSAGTAAGQQLTQTLARIRRDLARAGLDFSRDILPLLRGEVALWLAPAAPVPALTLVARAPDQSRTRAAMANLQIPLARLFAPPGQGAALTATFAQRSVDGAEVFSLPIAPAAEFDYAVFDGKLVVSTGLAGIRAVRRGGKSIVGSAPFHATLGDRPKRLSSLLFLDSDQLLRLGERIGLTQSQAYMALRPDLASVRAIGAVTSAGETDSTTEINVSIR